MPTRIWEVRSADKQGNPTITNVLLPDWKQITFSQMPPISKSGSINASQYTQAVGYDLSRSWQAGQTPDQYMKLGDISPLQPELLSVGAIAQATNLNLNQVALSTFTLVAEQTLDQLVKAVPLLGQFNVRDVAPVDTLLATKAVGIDVSSLQIAQVLAQNPQLGQLKLGETDLSGYSVSSIPNLDSTPLQQFTGWQNTFIEDVPGLNAVPLAAMPNPIAELGSLVMRIDTVYSKAEAKRTNTISGSDVQGFSVPCKGDCAYIELDDLENQGQVARGSLEGKQWISGKYQEVEGGWGCLKGVNGGKEPTGRLPFGSSFKVVVWDTDETTDSVTTALFFRFCSLCGCTPYFIGPVPFFTYRVNSPIFIGTLNERLVTAASMPTQAQQEVMSSSASTPKSVQDAVSTANVPCSPGETSEAASQGVNLDALGSAIALIGSDAQSDGFGPYVCADKGQNCGRALGKYQDMSYNPYAVKAISSKPGGEAWLSKIRSGGKITKEELFEFYPPADQEAAFNASLRDKIASTSKQIDPKTGKPYLGDRLIERVAQKHFGGEYSKVDSGASDTYGRLTVYNYGLDVLKRYKSDTGSTLTSAACTPTASSVSSSPPASSVLKATGKLVKPSNGLMTSDFGWQTHPVTAVRKMHNGLNYTAPLGSSVKAADGGVVKSVVSNCNQGESSCGGGYGNWIEIDHGNGRTTRYAHLQSGSIKVNPGDTVSQGQVIGGIGSTGLSTEPHLYFETCSSGSPVNPAQFGLS
ncbi:M23 family metallopeptidase [Iningainema sp. BLCCT55]|uniref:M23 family metallopeptidase n=1 Tax=Iningainema tapete BLCC-T55 TaxID=2748662 RepID=A0A8J7BXB4_9CYAN|nr:M23 family metallopeptidase [Iningainema tapete BLCC-T55]